MLLAADCFARFGSYMASVYIVLYAMNMFHVSPVDFGLLVSAQMTTSILGYLPAAKAADVYGRRPFILATFTFFSLYTLALGLTPTASLLPLAFVIAGLREIGEPARKALIVDLAEGPKRGQTIGLYYLIRETVGMPAPLLGALLWSASPRLLFLAASAVSAIGVVIYALTPKATIETSRRL